MPELLKIPLSSAEYLGDQLCILQRHYTFVDGNFVVMELLEEEPGLFALLKEAVRPLQIAFGDRRVFQARIQNSDDERLLKIAVQLPADLGGLLPEQALESFDAEWWLNNCHRSRGVLVFDYEIQDAL